MTSNQAKTAVKKATRVTKKSVSKFPRLGKKSLEIKDAMSKWLSTPAFEDPVCDAFMPDSKTAPESSVETEHFNIRYGFPVHAGRTEIRRRIWETFTDADRWRLAYVSPKPIDAAETSHACCVVGLGPEPPNFTPQLLQPALILRVYHAPDFLGDVFRLNVYLNEAGDVVWWKILCE